MFSNTGKNDSAILMEDPFFEGHLIFTESTGSFTPREEYSHELTRSTGGIGQTEQIAPGKSWSTAIFLQTYFASPPPGSYKINYKLEIPCFRKNGSETSAVSSGEFSFQVGPADPDQLKKIIRAYEEQLGSTDWRTGRTAAYALASTDNPIVVPDMPKLIELGDTEIAFAALARFKGNADAEKIVKTAIHSANVSRQLRALTVLSKWKSDIDNDDLTPLLSSPDRHLRIMTLRYVGKTGNPNHLPIITKMGNDPDAEIAHEASKTRQMLEGHNQ